MRSLWFFALVVCACGGDSKTKDAPAAGDATHDSKAIDAKLPDAPLDGPPGTQLLTVKNFDSWCSVAVNGGSASAAAVQQVFVLPGQIPLSATALSGFKLDAHMWHHTDGDAGSGEAGSANGSASDATATVSSTVGKCIWVCCPFTSGAGCAVPEQCQ
jgi:hypothetical protein